MQSQIKVSECGTRGTGFFFLGGGDVMRAQEKSSLLGLKSRIFPILQRVMLAKERPLWLHVEIKDSRALNFLPSKVFLSQLLFGLSDISRNTLVN